MHQLFQDHHRLCCLQPSPTLRVSTPWTFPASSRSASLLEGCLFSVHPTYPLVLEASSPSGHTASHSLWCLFATCSQIWKGSHTALPGRMMGNACRKDLVLWPQRAFACVPMSRVDTFYRTGHWPRRAVLAGPLQPILVIACTFVSAGSS